MRTVYSSVLLLALVCVSGCSGDSGTAAVASPDELKNFLEANPELNVPDNAHEEEDEDDE